MRADIGGESVDQDDITVLRRLRSSSKKRVAEEIADRTPCADFDKFQPLFELTERDLKSGVRKTLRFGRDASIEIGNFFILGGQLARIVTAGGMPARPDLYFWRSAENGGLPTQLKDGPIYTPDSLARSKLNTCACGLSLQRPTNGTW